MIRVEELAAKAAEQHEDFMKMARTIELRRLNEQEGHKTIVTIKGRPVVDDFGRVSDDTTIVFNTEQAANYYLMTGKYKLISVDEKMVDDEYSVIIIEVGEA